MIRPITPADSAALITLIVAAGLFTESETGFMEQMLADYFGSKGREGHKYLVDDEDGLRGVAYYAPEPVTDGTWNLLMIGVHPDSQRQGRGAALIQFVENSLRTDGQRLLLVETSALPDFAPARAFYARQGYEEEARIRDYYAAGDDMLTFSKKLSVD